jgi:TetR/AcrR family transcriptional regulator
MANAQAHPAGGRSEAQGAETRERILAAALSCFAAGGFDGTTTRQVAAEANVNLGLLQYHFGGKLDLWRAAVDLAFEDLRIGMNDVLSDESAMDDALRTRLLIRRYVRFVATHTEFIHLMHDEGKRDSPRMRWLVDRHVQPLYEAMRVFIERAQSHGLLPNRIDALHLHYILVGAVGLIFHQAAECRRMTGRDPFDDATIEAHADAVEALFLGARHEENPI